MGARFHAHLRVGLEHEAVAALLDVGIGHADGLHAPAIGGREDLRVVLAPLIGLGDLGGGDVLPRRVLVGRVLDLAQDHALVDELLERLLGGDDAEVEQEFVPEARVEQMQHRVLGTADVQVYGQPVVGRLGRDERVGVLGV